MAMIDILKLNAELDEMIRRQDEETKSMNDAVLVAREDRHAEMMADLEELYEVLMEIGGEVMVMTDILSPYGAPRREYYIRLNSTYGREFGIFSGTTSYLIPFTFNSSYQQKKNRVKRSSGLLPDVDKLVDEWAGQRDIFRRRFEEECVKLIKAKAAKANGRYEAAKKKYEEVVH